MFLLECSPGQPELSLVWNRDKPTALLVPRKMVPGATADSISSWLKVAAVGDSSVTAVLGDYELDDGIRFEPLIPFSRGISYDVFYRDKKIGDFQIPAADARNGPIVLAVYPAPDTLPQNLLKFYLRFSQPMSEGESGKHIKLIKNGTDTLRDVFLELQPELWNADRTVITIWLDPGRIKRGLQPNQGLGSPLDENAAYSLLITPGWKDNKGRSLQNGFTKSFVTRERDSLSPEPVQWALQVPAAGSRQPLVIDCKEPLDYFLLAESLGISLRDGPAVKGRFTINDEARASQFIPAQPWEEGEYTLVIQSILEDLAGNNINRLFDRDIYQGKPAGSDREYRVKFRIINQLTRKDTR